MTNSSNRWVPVLKGDTYCSPGCGFGCTKADYDAAVKDADALAKALGPGWKPEVHENCRWLYAAVSGPARVTPNQDFVKGGGRVVGYRASISSSPQALGRSAFSPLEAYERARLELEKSIETLTGILRGLP